MNICHAKNHADPNSTYKNHVNPYPHIMSILKKVAWWYIFYIYIYRPRRVVWVFEGFWSEILQPSLGIYGLSCLSTIYGLNKNNCLQALKLPSIWSWTWRKHPFIFLYIIGPADWGSPERELPLTPLAEPFPAREQANQQDFIRDTNCTIRVTIKSNLEITIRTPSNSATDGNRQMGHCYEKQSHSPPNGSANIRTNLRSEKSRNLHKSNATSDKWPKCSSLIRKEKGLINLARVQNKPIMVGI